jgi:two-component system sensor histidine kinase UhpB
MGQPSRQEPREAAAMRQETEHDVRQERARDLHDELGNLALVKLSLDRATADVEQGRPRDAARRLRETTALVSDTIASLRRVLLGLPSVSLGDLGLPAAVRVAVRQTATLTGITIGLRERGRLTGLLPRQETAVFRILQGALSNVARHSRAQRAAVVLAAGGGSGLRLTVDDDGVGFRAGDLGPAQSFGLIAMRDTARALGGEFQVLSPRRSRVSGRPGTRVEVRLPLLATDGA